MFILTVDDEFLLSEHLRGILEDAGHNVVATFDADEAIAILETAPEIEVVITDINLRGSMDGLRLAVAIRDRWPPIHLIVTTGQAHPLKSELPSGSPKPYRPDEILFAVRRSK
jgi:two-component system, response regulator PdtaR